MNYVKQQCLRWSNDAHLCESSKEELAVIHEMGFDDYFLIVWDIMRHAREKGIQTGAGRGLRQVHL